MGIIEEKEGTIMKYFTFIGTGTINLSLNSIMKKGGYESVSYRFADNGMVVKSKFIQEAIVERFKGELDKVYVFATSEAYSKHGEELKKHLNGVELTFIDIDKNIGFEEFSSLLLSKININDDIIIDITHSFRHIPMKLLFALDYIETAKDTNILHLYYGRLDGKCGLIEDIVKDYHMRKISDLLSQFDRTLIINTEDIKKYVNDDDKTISDLMLALADFNKVTELCRFDDCFTTIDRILKTCKLINSNPENYQMIVPFVKKIRVIFQSISNNNEVYNKIAFIKILLEHSRYQVAITFTDQLLREELIRYTFYPAKFDCDVYILSQTILAKSGLKYGKNNDCAKTFEKYPNRLESLTNISKSRGKTTNHFYNDLRNRINHGDKINKSEKEIKDICNDVLKLIQSLERELNSR